jgi:hypothetical protein
VPPARPPPDRRRCGRDATLLDAPLPRPATSPHRSGASFTFPARWRIPTFPARRRPLHSPGGDGGRPSTSARRSASPRVRVASHPQPVADAAPDDVMARPAPPATPCMTAPSLLTAVCPFSLPAVAMASTPSLVSDDGAARPGPFPDRWRAASPHGPVAVRPAPPHGGARSSGGSGPAPVASPVVIVSRGEPRKSASLDKHGVNLLLVCTSVCLYSLIHNVRAGLTICMMQ